MNNDEIQALITVGALQVGRVKENNAALRAIKRQLLTAMEAIGTDAIDSTARAVVGICIAPPVAYLDLDQLNDATIIYLARKNVLRTSRSAWATLAEDERASLAAVAVIAEPSAEFYFNVNKKGEQIAPTPGGSVPIDPAVTVPARTAPVSLAEKRLGREGAIASVAEPLQRQQSQPNRAQPPEQVDEWHCPLHPAREPKESKFGGFYCTAKNDETKSGYCTLSTNKKAS